MEKGNACRTSLKNHQQQQQQHKVNVGQMFDRFKVKGFSWDFSSGLQEGDLVAAGFSWPPRSYCCSFCKREFRSAQALGGHMNVHRRDRARLRLSPVRDGAQFSLIHSKLDPSNTAFNTNPNSNSSPRVFFNPISIGVPTEVHQIDDETKIGGFQKEKVGEGKQGDQLVRLELEIGLIGEAKEELDLELRLGYNN